MKVILSFTLTAALILIVVSLVSFEGTGLSLDELNDQVYSNDLPLEVEGEESSSESSDSWSWINLLGIFEVANIMEEKSDESNVDPLANIVNEEVKGTTGQMFISGVYIPIQVETKDESLSTLDAYLKYRSRMNQVIDALTITSND